MAYKAYITKITNVRQHPNADRLQLGDCFGNTVCVSLEYTEGQLGIYFPEGGQLSEEFAEHNNLVRKKDESGNNIGGYLEPGKRNIKAIKLRGEKSDGLFLPISCLDYTNTDVKEGDAVDILGGHEICCKYIPRTNHVRGAGGGGNKTRKRKIPVAPLFTEHADTEQLAYHLDAFRPDDHIEITLKMHGSSQRTAHLPVIQGYKRSLLDKLLHREGTPIYDWGYVSGTRRTVLEDFEGGYYGSNSFREPHSKAFEGKLLKGETVYYEVVAYTDNGTPIMGEASNKKVNDKEFVKTYGDTTVFSYGCEPGESDFYVYRMTMTNEDGDVVEYTPDFMRYRCEQMNVKTVPVFDEFFIPGNDYGDTPGEFIKHMAEKYYDGPDPIGKNHIREGVVIRIVNRPKFTAYKHKNYFFKVLSGIVIDQAESNGMEMSNDIAEEM